MYKLKIISMHFTQHYNYNALPDYQSAITIHMLIVFKRIQFHSGACNVPIALRTESVWIFPQMQTEAKNSKSIHTNPLLNYVSPIQQSKTDARLIWIQSVEARAKLGVRRSKQKWIFTVFFSVSKTTRELLLHWDHSDTGKSVTVSSDLRMPQFIVESVNPTLCYERFHLGKCM